MPEPSKSEKKPRKAAAPQPTGDAPVEAAPQEVEQTPDILDDGHFPVEMQDMMASYERQLSEAARKVMAAESRLAGALREVQQLRAVVQQVAAEHSKRGSRPLKSVPKSQRKRS